MPQPKGLYADSSVSSCAGEEEDVGRCECGNMIQLDLDLDAAVHPTTEKNGDRNTGTFSPDISETQKAVASPRNAHMQKERRTRPTIRYSKDCTRTRSGESDVCRLRGFGSRMRTKRSSHLFHPQTMSSMGRERQRRAKRQVLSDLTRRRKLNVRIVWRLRWGNKGRVQWKEPQNY